MTQMTPNKRSWILLWHAWGIWGSWFAPGVGTWGANGEKEYDLSKIRVHCGDPEGHILDVFWILFSSMFWNPLCKDFGKKLIECFFEVFCEPCLLKVACVRMFALLVLALISQ